MNGPLPLSVPAKPAAETAAPPAGVSERSLEALAQLGLPRENAAAYLAHQGFAEVYSLDGGFELWRSQYPDQIARSDAE